MKTAHDNYQTKFVSAPCGSGKTYSTCKYIKSNLHNRNSLYIAPTILLIEETSKELEKRGIKPTVITSITANGNKRKSVRRDIVEFLRTCDTKGEVLLICMPSYIELTKFNRRENWDVFIDEIPQIDRFYSLDLHQNRDHLMEYVKLGDPINESTLPVYAANKSRLRKLLGNPDDVTKQLLQFYRDLINPNKNVFVDLHSWNKFEADEVSTAKDANRVFFLSMLSPKAFHNCTLIGANIEYSLIYDWFARYHDVTFNEHEAIVQQLRYSTHSPNTGDRLCISYLLPDRGHSKHLMRQNIDGKDTTWGHEIDQTVARHYGDERFLYAANNDYSGSLIGLDNAVRIPAMSHGLNAYSKEVNFYFGPALNRQPQHRTMLNNLGFENHTIKSSTLHEAAYQALMRTALRDPDSKVLVNCVVPEYETAKRIVEIFDGAQIKFIGDYEFKKVQPLTNSERKKRSNFFKTKRSLFVAHHGNQKLVSECDHTDNVSDFDDLPRKGYKSLINNTIESRTQIGADHGLIADSFDKTSNLSDANSRANGCSLSDANDCQVDQWFITIHDHYMDRDHTAFIDIPVDLQGLIKLLREAANTVINDKDELFLINPTTFNNTDPEGHRRQVNFMQSSMMVLDFDDGDLSINEFEDMFWTKAGRGKRSFVICNTFSRREGHPNRFRVFMFYKHPVYSLELHQAIYDSIVSRLEANGFTEESAQLDRTCRNGIQSFYLPCTNRKHPNEAYFEQWGTNAREVKQYGIEPQLYAKTAIQPVEKLQIEYVDSSSIVVPGGMSKKDRIDKILESVRALPFGRHKPFFNAGVKLRSMGLPDHEIQYHLEFLESDIGKQKYRWAKDAMRSLRTVTTTNMRGE